MLKITERSNAKGVREFPAPQNVGWPAMQAMQDRGSLLQHQSGVNSAFFKFFKDRETFEEFSCKTLINHRDKSQQHTRDLYWFGLLTYSSPQATPLENSLKNPCKTPYKKQGTLANTCPCASLFSTSFARDNLTFHSSTTQSIAFDDLVAELQIEGQECCGSLNCFSQQILN